MESAGEGLYDENDALTAENIEAVRARTGELPVWRLIEANWGRIRAAIDGARRTLTYNDFYYTNLAVARDGSSALMFDYGLLGKGYAYADIRNVLSSLSPAAGEAFLAGYGPFDAREEQIDGVANVLLGCARPMGARRRRPGRRRCSRSCAATCTRAWSGSSGNKNFFAEDNFSARRGVFISEGIKGGRDMDKRDRARRGSWRCGGWWCRLFGP